MAVFVNGGPPERAAGAEVYAPPSPTVSVLETEPAWLVFREYKGPYWQVGLLLAQVRDYMAEHAQTGPLFVRYDGRPIGAGAGSLSCRVGFMAGSDHHPVRPFKTARRDKEPVARMVIEGRSATTRRDYAVIYDWIERNGYAAAGPVMEIYGAVSSGQKPAAQRTEIQVSLVKTVGRILTTQDDRNVETRQPAKADTADGPTPRPREAEADRSVRELVAAGLFDRIAEQLMPDADAIPGPLQLWFGQIVFRIEAAAMGVSRLHPGGDEVVRGMAEAITRRYKVVSSGFQFDPLDQVVVSADVRNDPLGARKRSVLRDLDTLLGRIAYGGVDPRNVAGELADIVQRVRGVLRAGQEAACAPLP